MKKISFLLVMILFLFVLINRSYPAPTLADTTNYSIELFASGAGAVALF